MKSLLAFLMVEIVLTVLETSAANYTVTSGGDAGPGSLRQAIADANATVVPDTIMFAPALNGSTLLLTNGQLSVSNSLTILGPGADQLTIDGNGSNRVFYLAPGLTNLIAGLAITRGSPSNNLGGGIYNDHSILTLSNVTLNGNSANTAGGGIYNNGNNGGTAWLKLQHCTLSGNKAFYGAGVNNDGGSAGSAILALVDCTITGNSTFVQGGTSTGGGIHNVGMNGGSAQSTLRDCILTGNSAVAGGGIYNDGRYGSAPLVLQHCTVSSNYAVYAGGIYNEIYVESGSAPLALTNCIVSGNIGGGIQNSDGVRTTTLTLQDCVVSGNSAEACDGCGGHDGGGIENWGSILTLLNCNISGNSSGHDASGGGIYHNGTFGSISNCTISGNWAAQYGGGGIRIKSFTDGDTFILRNCTISSNFTIGWGGGIDNEDSQVTVQNCTFSGNSAYSGGGGVANLVYDGSASLTLRHCTFSGNSAVNGGGIDNNGGASGNATLTIEHTLLAKGTNGANFHNSGAVTNLGYNLSDDDSTSAFAATVTNLMMGPLADNGGPTLTHALLAGSPAIDAGNPDLVNPPTFDQRGAGFPRVFNGIIDIGALESQPVAPRLPVLIDPMRFAQSNCFGFVFTNLSGARFSVVTTTNLASPWSEWMVMGGVVEITPGRYQFIGAQSSNAVQKFYRIRSP